VKGCIEHGYLGYIGCEALDSLDAFQIGRVVFGCQHDHLADGRLHLRRNADAVLELCAAMHHAVTHDIDVRQAINNVCFAAPQRLEHVLDHG
jgi:hypothetical protein